MLDLSVVHAPITLHAPLSKSEIKARYCHLVTDPGSARDVKTATSITSQCKSSRHNDTIGCNIKKD